MRFETYSPEIICGGSVKSAFGKQGNAMTNNVASLAVKSPLSSSLELLGVSMYFDNRRPHLGGQTHRFGLAMSSVPGTG